MNLDDEYCRHAVQALYIEAGALREVVSRERWGPSGERHDRLYARRHALAIRAWLKAILEVVGEEDGGER